MTTNDPYQNIARNYDRFFGSMNQGLRVVGMRMHPPSEGMSVLDVGCGTGMLLELYQGKGCDVYGLDLSPSMLAVAEQRLGDSAHLELGDATQMPYEDDMFDIVTTMLTLHEMNPEIRDGVLREMGRVVKDEGRIILIDFHTGPYKPLQGWISKTIIHISEILAGRDHFRNYRKYMKAGGLPALIAAHGLRVEKQRILAGGTFMVMVLRS